MSLEKCIDLTTARKGSRSPLGKIIVCPKCGKKGAAKPATGGHPEGSVPMTVAHQYHTANLGGFVFNSLHSGDYCSIRFEDAPLEWRRVYDRKSKTWHTPTSEETEEVTK